MKRSCNWLGGGEEVQEIKDEFLDQQQAIDGDQKEKANLASAEPHYYSFVCPSEGKAMV